MESLLSQVFVAIVVTLSIQWIQKVLGPRISIRLRQDEFGVNYMTIRHEERVRLPSMPMPGEQVGKLHEQIVSSYEEDLGYVRLRVTNERFGVAKGCRGFLADCLRREANGNFRRVFFDSVPLSWSYLDAAAPQTLDIPRNVELYLDVLRTEKDRADFMPCMIPFPKRYRTAFSEAGVYRFKIVVAAENAAAATCWLQFDWTGQWNNLAAEEIPSPL